MKKNKIKTIISYVILAIYLFASVSMQVYALEPDCDSNVVMKFINDYWGYVLVLAPVGLIILCAMDFVKAMANGDNDAIKKATNSAIKRAVAVVLLFLLKPLVRMVFAIFGLESYSCF